jgi:hypothetical protein
VAIVGLRWDDIPTPKVLGVFTTSQNDGVLKIASVTDGVAHMVAANGAKYTLNYPASHPTLVRQ